MKTSRQKPTRKTTAKKRRPCAQEPIPCVPLKLGYETIYPQQQRLAERTMSVLLENEASATGRRSPIILLQPQGGKTGAIEWLIWLFINDCQARGLTFQVIVLCGLPHITLIEQTRNRLTESVRPSDGVTPFGARLDRVAKDSGLLRLPQKMWANGIVCVHNSTPLRRLDLGMPVDRRLWIGDEVHLGNVKDGNIDVLLKNHGVRVCEQIHTWDNSKTTNHFVGVSATPSAHMLKDGDINPPLSGESLFKIVYEAPPENYNSPAKMRANERLRQTETLVQNGQPTTFWKKVWAEFLQNCEVHGPGHLVVRATGKKHAQLMSIINRRGRKIECREFDSESQNIDELNAFLATQPAGPMIVVIRGSMRAGITLEQKHFIRGWVETESVTSDTQAQSGVGRACGYDRSQDTYPIYCDLKHIDAWIEAYAALDKKNPSVPIPSGVQNHALKAHARYPVLGLLDYKSAWDTHVKPHRHNDKNKAGKKGSERYRFQFASTQQVFLDIAGMFLEGRRDSGSTIGIRVNGPTPDAEVRKYIKTHPKLDPEVVWGWARRNHESYKKLLQQYPEAAPKVGREDKVLYFGDKGVPTISSTRTRDELQRRKSATRSV